MTREKGKGAAVTGSAIYIYCIVSRIGFVNN